MTYGNHNKPSRLYRYLAIEWGINKEYRKRLDRIKYATTYEDVEKTVKGFKDLVESALERIRHDYPEFYYEAKEIFKTLHNSLKSEAQKRINEIAIKRLKRI